MAVCGRTVGRAAELARRHHIPEVYAGFEEMFRRVTADAAVITASDDVHHPAVMAALERGMHVLCEKPLAHSHRQAMDMLEKAEAAGVRHMVNFSLRWFPHVRYVKELVEGGFVGECRHLHVQMNGSYGRGSAPFGWRFDRNRSNGILGDLGSHAIDAARWLAGDIRSAVGYTSSFVDRTNPDDPRFRPSNDSAAMAVRFEGGAHGTIQVSAVTAIGDRRIEVRAILHGESGTIEALGTIGGRMEVRRIGAGGERFQLLEVPDRFWHGMDRKLPFLQAVEHQVDRCFIDAILDDTELSPTFRDGVKAQEVIEAVGEAAG